MCYDSKPGSDGMYMLLETMMTKNWKEAEGAN